MASPLSQTRPQANERTLALTVLGISTGLFVLLAPFAPIRLPAQPLFIPVYQGLLLLSDLLTAAIFFAEFRATRRRALLVLASAYLFTALLIVPHTLSFPGLYAPQGLMGAGPQTTAWLYMFWHAGFPLLVIVYAFIRHDTRPLEAHAAWLLFAFFGSAVAAFGFGLLTTRGHDNLPAVMAGNGYTFAMLGVMTSVWLLSMLALLVLWLRGPHSTLDLWMMVAMAAWVFDIGLAAALNAGRWDLGFYAGRIYGLLAASFVLLMLLRERRARNPLPSP